MGENNDNKITNEDELLNNIAKSNENEEFLNNDLIEDNELLNNISNSNESKENGSGNSENNSSNKEFRKKTKRKQRIIIVVLIITIIFVVVFFAILIKNNFFTTNNLKIELAKSSDVENSKNVNKIISSIPEKEKEVLNIKEENNISEETKKEIENNKSNEYKKYEQLTEEEKNKLEIIPKEENVPIETLDTIEDETNDNNIIIPRKYSLSEKINIIPKNQGSYGLCWDFASTKSVETFLALNKKQNYNLSEIHADYLESDLMFGGRKVHESGNFSVYIDYLLRYGPVNQMEYRDYNEKEYISFTDSKKEIYVTDVVNFPTINKQYGVAPLYTDEELTNFRNQVKKQIMTNGSVYAQVKSSAKQNSYCVESCYTDHAVSIVGWDDDYPKENFVAENGAVPKNNGAYLALNSWGDYYADTKEYYYISYEDEIVETAMSGITSTSLDSTVKVSNIKNEKLKETILNNIGKYTIVKDGAEYLPYAAFKNISYLQLNNMNITNEDLKIISNFKNLSYLELKNNKITDLSELEKIKNLAYLDVSNNKKIKNYSKLITLGSLNLSGCDITELEDLSSLSKLNGELYLNNNSISNYVSNIPNTLTTLSLVNTGIVDLSFLNTFTELINLNISDNNIKSFIGINSSSLESLTANNTDIDSFYGLENINIYFMEINNSKITDISSMKNCNIDTLNIEDNKEIDFTNFENSYLSVVYLKNIENIISLNNLNNVKVLSVINSKFNSTELSLLNNIETLIIKKCNFTDFTALSSMEKLNYLDLSENDIKNISGLEKLTNLNYLSLNDNNISDIDTITSLTNLSSLSLANNSFKDLSSINKISNLSSVNLDGNKNLDGKLTGPNLTSISLINCGLTDDSVFKPLKNISYIDVSDNDINNYEFLLNRKSETSLIFKINETLTLNEIEKINSYKDDTNQFYIVGAKLEIEKQEKNGKIDISDDWNLRKIVSNSSITSYYSENILYGYTDNYNTVINLTNKDKKQFLIDTYNINNFSGLRIVINY